MPISTDKLGEMITDLTAGVADFKVEVARQHGEIKSEISKTVNDFKVEVAQQHGAIRADISKMDEKLTQVDKRVDRAFNRTWQIGVVLLVPTLGLSAWAIKTAGQASGYAAAIQASIDQNTKSIDKHERNLEKIGETLSKISLRLAQAEPPKQSRRTIDTRITPQLDPESMNISDGIISIQGSKNVQVAHDFLPLFRGVCIVEKPVMRLFRIDSCTGDILVIHNPDDGSAVINYRIVIRARNADETSRRMMLPENKNSFVFIACLINSE